MQNELRQDRRVLVSHLLSVYREPHQAVGHVVNLSHRGFMLIGPEPMPENQLQTLTMDLPEIVDGVDSVSFEARCVWCQRSSFGKDYGAGFQIERISEPDASRLRFLFGDL